MILTSIIIPVLSLVAVFLWSIHKFSGHIHRAADGGFKRALQKITSSPIRGVFTGGIFTSLIQSSTATTVILVGLVNAGVLSFSHSIGVILGANIGTTITSQLVALKITNIAPYIIIIGFLITYFGRRYKSWGKPIFYFGLVFFSLSLISLYIEPVRTNPDVISIFSGITNPLTAIIAGFLFTAIVQSSSVTSALVIVIAGTGLLDFNQAFPIILGAKLGTTVTVLLVAMSLNREAKRTAVAHFLFNFLGLLIFLPFLVPFANLVAMIGGGVEQNIASAHILFALINAIIFLILFKPFTRVVQFIVP